MHRIVSVSIFVVVSAHVAVAQGQKPRLAGIAPAPRPTQPAPDASANGLPVVYSTPVLVTADGRIFANFGYGYEQVVRSCGNHQSVTGPSGYQPSTVPSQTAGAASSESTPPTYQPSTFGPANTQPAPAQPTASERMLPQGYAPPNTGASQQRAGSTACYTTDPRGHIIVFR